MFSINPSVKLCCFLVVLSLVKGDGCDSIDCSKRKLPLLDNIKAPHMVKRDVSSIKDEIKDYIDAKIEEALKEDVRKSNFVGFTAQGKFFGSKPPGTILKFPIIKTSYGLPVYKIFRPNGQFQVPYDGFYFITVSVTARGKSLTTNFQIFQNNAAVSGDYYTGRSGTDEHYIVTSGSGSIILNLSSGDLIDVRTANEMYVYDYFSSLTIFRIN